MKKCIAIISLAIFIVALALFGCSSNTASSATPKNNVLTFEKGSYYYKSQGDCYYIAIFYTAKADPSINYKAPEYLSNEESAYIIIGDKEYYPSSYLDTYKTSPMLLSGTDETVKCGAFFREIEPSVIENAKDITLVVKYLPLEQSFTIPFTSLTETDSYSEATSPLRQDS